VTAGKVVDEEFRGSELRLVLLIGIGSCGTDRRVPWSFLLMLL
jgi:hypothetical protein